MIDHGKGKENIEEPTKGVCPIIMNDVVEDSEGLVSEFFLNYISKGTSTQEI